jgi:hypothetical protein
VPTPRYRPIDLLKDPERWGEAGTGDWRLPQQPDEAARLVVSVEQERLAKAIDRRLRAEGRSIPQLADAIGVSYTQLFAKLKGTVPLRPEEFVGWQWLLGEHRGVRVPKADTALAHVAASRRARMTGTRWPFQ